MVFWGVELTAGKPYVFSPSEDEESQLHLSQATLGLDALPKNRVVLKVKVGDNPEILVCSLTSGLLESCPLDLIFEEDATFSIAGKGSVHLSGYFMPISEEHHYHPEDADEGEDEDWDEEGEDDDEFDSEDGELDGFDSLEDDEDDLPQRKSSVVIEEIHEGADGAPNGGRGKDLLAITGAESKGKKSQKKEKQAGKGAPPQAEAEAEAEAEAAEEEGEEDKDGFLVVGAKRAAAAVAQEEKQKKKKKQSAEAKKPEAALESESKGEKGPKVAPASKPEELKAEAGKQAEAPLSKKEKKEKASKKAPQEAKQSAELPSAKEAKKSAPEPAAKEGKSPKQQQAVVRKFPNGLEVHELSLGKPNAKQATPGKRVFMYYTGKLKSNGKQFDSNIGKKPFSFRLGVGEVIKGWDVGVQGMRVGDKRKLIIPPPMGYGAKGAPGAIPGNAWLLFDIELVDVK